MKQGESDKGQEIGPRVFEKVGSRLGLTESVSSALAAWSITVISVGYAKSYGLGNQRFGSADTAFYRDCVRERLIEVFC